MKTLSAKKVNNYVKNMNRKLHKDIFGSRFEARQLQKSICDGVEFFLYELVDNEQPERNRIVPWETAYAICRFHRLDVEMNDFIVSSDFWAKYRRENPR